MLYLRRTIGSVDVGLILERIESIEDYFLIYFGDSNCDSVILYLATYPGLKQNSKGISFSRCLHTTLNTCIFQTNLYNITLFFCPITSKSAILGTHMVISLKTFVLHHR